MLRICRSFGRRAVLIEDINAAKDLGEHNVVNHFIIMAPSVADRAQATTETITSEVFKLQLKDDAQKVTVRPCHCIPLVCVADTLTRRRDLPTLAICLTSTRQRSSPLPRSLVCHAVFRC